MAVIRVSCRCPMVMPNADLSVRFFSAEKVGRYEPGVKRCTSSYRDFLHVP